eukprot:UN25737
MQKRIRENQDSNQELELLRIKLDELRGLREKDENSHLNADARRRISYDHLKQNFDSINAQMKGAEKAMDDVVFFVGLKNTVDDYVDESGEPVEPSSQPEQENERMYIQPLKSKKTFEELKKEKETDKILSLYQKLSRDIDEDRISAKRALKEISSKTNNMKNGFDECSLNIDRQNKQIKVLDEVLNDWEVQIQNALDRTNKVEIYKDYRDDEVKPDMINRV